MCGRTRAAEMHKIRQRLVQSNDSHGSPGVFPIRRFLLLLCAAALLTACSGGYALGRLDASDAPPHGAIAWFSPAVAGDRLALARWRASVGPPIVGDMSSAIETRSDEITVVSWNTALGEADVARFYRELPEAAGGRPVVLLLQEVYRRGPMVPRLLTASAAFARRLGGASDGLRASDVDAIAASLGMRAYYVPSMRNGGRDSDEDRGNAILSNLPLAHLAAVELPFEKQRRVAVDAEVAGVASDGAPWRLRVVSAHLDNAVPRRAWIASEYGRARQARALVEHLRGDTPTVLAGDFNTWFGFTDQAYIETSRAFPQTVEDDRRATFRGMLRLDHVFYRLPPTWTATLRRADNRFGSDHSPLIGTIRVR